MQSVCITASFTAEPVEEGLRFWMAQLDWSVDMAFAPYGQLFQSLLDPKSELGRNRDGANLVFLRWADISPSGGTRVDDVAAALRESCERTHVPHFVVTGPPEPHSGCDERALDAELREKLSPTNASGIALAHLITGQELLEQYPVAEVFDTEAHRIGHVPYTEAFFAALATSVMRALRCLRAPPRKVLVLDCDNTLWRGVVGEDGPEGVDSGGAFAGLQSLLVRQAAQGKLLCLASKNAEADVWSVFDRHAMPLERQHITAHRINWLPKSENLQALAQELGLGLDSFIFIDDSPVECAEVRAACPEVLTVELPKNVAARPRLIENLWALDQLRVTSADRTRAQTYEGNAARGQMRRAAASLEAFLQQLDLTIDVAVAQPDDVPRIAQLSQRTNQFNATTRRRDEGAVRGMLETARPVTTGASLCRVVRVRDRFGDYGLVGVLLATGQESALVVDSFMLSCRALGRGVEHCMLAHLGLFAVEHGFAEVRVPFLPTPRNEPIRRFLESLPSAHRTPHESGESGAAWYVLTAEQARTVRLTFDQPDGADAATADSTSADTRMRASELTVAPSPPTVSEPELILDIATRLSSVGAVLSAIRAARHRRRDLDGYAAPREKREQELASIWREVLGLDRIGVRDRFSDLGGTSLHLVRIHGLVIERMGIDVDLTTLFSHATVESLSRFLAAQANGGAMAAVRRRAVAQKLRRDAHLADAPRLQSTRRGATRP